MAKVNADDFSISKENKKDYRQTVIARANLTNHFTIESLEDHEAELKKAKETLNAQIKLTNSVIDNVERNHKKVAGLTEEELATAAYLYENKALKVNSENKLKEINASLKKYKETLDVIYTKFGFVKPEKGIKFKVVYENEEPGQN
jgi:hypothetical protein